MESLQIEIVTKCGSELKKTVTRIIADGIDGSVEILPEHSHFLTFLKEGSIILDEIDEENIVNQKTFECGEGILEVMEDNVRLLVDYIK